MIVPLFSSGAEINATESNGFSAIHAAAFAGHPEAVRVLLSLGSPLYHHESDGLHPIHRSVYGRTEAHAECVKAFLQAGVSVDESFERDGQTITLVDLATRSKSKDIINVIEEYMDMEERERE